MVEVSVVGYVKAPGLAVMVRPGALVCLEVSAGRTVSLYHRSPLTGYRPINGLVLDIKCTVVRFIVSLAANGRAYIIARMELRTSRTASILEGVRGL